MRPSPPTRERPPASRELSRSGRSLVLTMILEYSFGDVERTVLICLDQVVKAALRSSGQRDGSTLFENAHNRPLVWWNREPVVVEIKSARRKSRGLVAHLRWLPQRPKILAAMEANMLVRRGRGACVELILDCSYSLPAGGLGFADDLLARSVAQSTAESFIEGLACAVEDNLRHRAMTRTAKTLEVRNVKAPPRARRWTSDVSRWRWRKATGSASRWLPRVLAARHGGSLRSERSSTRGSLGYYAAPRPARRTTSWPAMDMSGGSRAWSRVVPLNESDFADIVRR